MKWYFKRNILNLAKMATVEFVLKEKAFSNESAREMDGVMFTVRRVTHLKQLNKDSIIETINKMDINPTFDVGEIERRLQDGHFFFLVESMGKIVGWSWNGVNKVFFDEFNCNLHLKPKHTFSYNTYITKEHRGKQLNHLILNEKFRILKENGYEKVWGLIYHHNKRALTSALNYNYDMIGNYYLFKLFYMNFHFPPKKLME